MLTLIFKRHIWILENIVFESSPNCMLVCESDVFEHISKANISWQFNVFKLIYIVLKQKVAKMHPVGCSSMFLLLRQSGP